MKLLRKYSYSILALLLLLPFIGVSQNIETKDSLNLKLINAAREIMTAAGDCALTTLDEEGRPRVRAMSPFLPEDDLTVWFGTNPKSRKVEQIKNDSRVTLFYLDSDASGYVMIHGTAQIIDDPKEEEKYWKNEWESFYPNRPVDYLLIKVTPLWLEVISYTRGVFGDPATWQPPKVIFDIKQ